MTDEQDKTSAEPLRVGVLGARGRMGIEVCKAVDAADDLELAASIDQGDSRSAVSAAEVVVGLAIIMSIFRSRRSASVDDANLLKF